MGIVRTASQRRWWSQRAHLLLVGFYLVNVGFVSLALRYGTKPTDLVGAFEFLSTKVGLVVVILGFMHFTNMRLLVRYRASKLFRVLAPTDDTSDRLDGIGAEA